ncbi:MAG: DUF6370 family protein [Tepidisphaeraceae bacterium]|jgi:hypothetical protein
MRNFARLALSLLVIIGFAGISRAADTTLKGTLTCAKCGLKETTECQNVLVVKDGEKTVNYYLTANDVSKGSHGAVCHGPKDNITVTGTVEEKDGKKWITASKIEGLEEKKG